jgi:uncharacterized protein YbjT (DUF2867 family)
MRVFVTGGTGFVGSRVVDALLADGHEVPLLVHRRTPPARPGVTSAKGNVAKGEIPDLRGHDAVVHLVGILVQDRNQTFETAHVGATRGVVEAAKRAGVRRYLHMSANGVDARDTPYFRTKADAEDIVRASGLDWTIFRPSFIAGEGKGFDAEFARVIRLSPVVPVVGGGRFFMQPVTLRDVALAFARALRTREAVGKTYCIGGPETLEFREYLPRLASLMGKRRAFVPLPKGLALAMARLPGFPANVDQLKMLFAGNSCPPGGADWTRDLGILPQRWEDGLAHLRPAAGAR